MNTLKDPISKEVHFLYRICSLSLRSTKVVVGRIYIIMTTKIIASSEERNPLEALAL